MSIAWPSGLRILIEAHANVDAADLRGYTPIFYAAFRHVHESICLLGEEDCCLYTLQPQGQEQWDTLTLLGYVLGLERCQPWTQRAVQDARLTVDIIISILTKRLRSLEKLAIKHLPHSSIRELGIEPDRLLDSNAENAIEMLEQSKVRVPQSLRTIGKAPVPQTFLSTASAGNTVYHTCGLSVRQAELLWKSGFREIDKLNRCGTSPMICWRGTRSYELDEELELTGWFLSKGVTRYQLEPYAYRSKDWRTQQTGIKSSIAALHYFGQRLGRHGLSSRMKPRSHHVQWTHTYLEESYPRPNISSIRLIREILRDPFRDSCQCPCSSSGCLAFTQMIKQPGPLRSPNNHRISDDSQAALHDTYCAALLLDIDHTPEGAWLRSEIFRFHTFEKLKLRHTCCTTVSKIGLTIVELGDKEDRQEIRLEQEEQVERMEELVLEFENKYQDMGLPLIDFFEGYWHKRMDEVLEEEEQHEMDTAKLTEIGVVRHDDDEARVRDQIKRMG